jgi:hypothetical protein
MNLRCVFLSGIVTCLLGAVLGVAVAEMNRDDPNPQAHLHYAIAGAMIGLVVGSGQEALRQISHEEV